MSEKLELGYDLFDSIMRSRETQAGNIAWRLHELSRTHDLPIFIHGKSYKPGIDLVDGSYSLLIGHYLEKTLGYPVTYIDPLTEDSVPEEIKGVILLAHCPAVTYDDEFRPFKLYCEIVAGSVVLDPWRKYTDLRDDVTVIHYGNTRNSST
jgi:UDPglucose 6-dehydrogenase